MPLRSECMVEDVEALRVPRVYRVKASCRNGLSMEIELHEDIIAQPSKGRSIVVEVTEDKGKCLEHYFCAHGYVVSNTQIGDVNRVVISLNGLLTILKTREALGFKPMDKIYLGITIG